MPNQVHAEGKSTWKWRTALPVSSSSSISSSNAMTSNLWIKCRSTNHQTSWSGLIRSWLACEMLHEFQRQWRVLYAPRYEHVHCIKVLIPPPPPSYSLSLICQPNIRGHEAPHYHHPPPHTHTHKHTKTSTSIQWQQKICVCGGDKYRYYTSRGWVVSWLTL